MEYTISTPKRDAARRAKIAAMRAEMEARARRVPLAVRIEDAIKAAKPWMLAALFIGLMLAASYGDTLSGVNPS